MKEATSGPVDYLSLLRLDNRGCIVLGSGPGMGRATANALAQAGARILCVDMDERILNEVAHEVNGYAYKADIRRREEVERVFSEAKAKLGRIDGVVDIVGYNRLQFLREFDDEALTWVYDMLLRHAYLTLQVGAHAMAEGGGTMVFVGSNGGLVSFYLHWFIRR